MALVTELLEKGKEYGREFVLLVIVLIASGAGLRIVWDTMSERLMMQDARIEKSENYIRGDLKTLTEQSMAITSKATDVMSRAVDALDRNTEALRDAQK